MNRVRVSVIVIVAALTLAGSAFAQDKPKDPPKTDVSGAWDVSVETPQGARAMTTTFKQEGEKLTGSLAGEVGEFPLQGTIKGGDIAFAVVIDMQGQQLTLAYAGKVDGEAMSGTVELGTFGSSTWTAKKKK
jgi:hypothetical protein